MCEWILTDDATEQHVKVISEELGKYGVIDTIPYSRQKFAVVYGAVTVTEADLRNPAFVTAYLHPYGYESAQEMHQYYGPDACQIAAECVFETSPLSHGDVLFEGTKKACFKYINKYVGGIDEQDKHNADMKAQLLSFEQIREQTAEGLLFDATVLTMNQNTNRYETSSELLLRQQFMDEDLLWRDMIKVSVHPIAADALFEISCTPLLHADDRVMLYEDQAVVTGKALIELLTSPDTSEAIGSVNERRQTLAAFRSSLEDLRDGRIRNLFNPTSASRIQLALNRLEKEEERLHESV